MTSTWQEPETPVLVPPDGKPVTRHLVGRALRAAAARVCLGKPVNRHVPRKSLGPLTGRENPKSGAQQFGTTGEVLSRSFTKPHLEDRLARRDALRGAEGRPRTPDEAVGHAYLECAGGRISNKDSGTAVSGASSLRALPGAQDSED